ncbi:hypothetical protein GCM10009740_01460 [Terrabacter terrae]|uniref:Uncharacterized protein n=1 Tax=Terrabacter terrae TaxID=318434 RepID=A0ABP5F9S5_9MICO
MRPLTPRRIRKDFDSRVSDSCENLQAAAHVRATTRRGAAAAWLSVAQRGAAWRGAAQRGSAGADFVVADPRR